MKAREGINIKSGLKKFTHVVKTCIVLCKNLIPIPWLSKFLGSFMYKYQYVAPYFICIGNPKPRDYKWMKAMEDFLCKCLLKW